jgi:glycerophosphoryl diester phosphodiesterase
LPNTTPKNSPLIIGHRGASALAPENTLSAFQRALADGAAGIELDVRLAGDGVPVVIHDATLRRTGLREGVVAKMTSRELCEVEVGTWFSRAQPQIPQSGHSRQFVPTLDQIFDLFTKPPNRDKVIYVELKTNKAEKTFAELAGSVAEIINARGLRHRVVVVSFNLKAIARIKTADSTITTGALFEPRRDPLKAIRKHPIITAAIECGADQILLHRLIATARLINLAMENNLVPVVWTVDDPGWMRRSTSLGIHGLITNNPALMIASLAQKHTGRR